MEWLWIWGGIVTLLWGAWLFADFLADEVAAYMRVRVHHD